MKPRTALWCAVLLAAVLAGVFMWLVRGRSLREIANFSTTLTGRTPGQLHNLRTALQRLSGTVVRPNDVFSLNHRLGERTSLRGYREAPTIWNGMVIDTPGGGLCQLSSTLYNAALLANLPIVERHPHLYAVASVGPGRDAALLDDRLDLRFRNNLPFPLTLEGAIEGERLIVRLKGPGWKKAEVSIHVERLSTIAPPRIPRAALTGRQAGSSAGAPGMAVRAWRLVRLDGRQSRELLSEDRYAPEPAVAQ